MRVNRRVLGLALAFIAIAGLGGFTLLQMRAAKDADAGADGSDSAAVRLRLEETAGAGSRATDVAIPVEGIAVVQDTLVVSVTATGQAAAQRQVVIAAQVPGRIADLPIRESGRVAAAGLVLALDAAEYRIGLEQARARMRSAEATFREQTLFDDKIEDAALRAERSRVARAKSGLDGAELDVQKAQLDLDRTRLSAPFAGQVANLKVVPGQYVTAGAEVATLVDLDPIKVEVQVLESEVGFLTPGRRATVSFAAFPGEPFAGTIESINPVVDQATRTARVTVVVRNPDRRILPGMYARVSLEARRFPDRVIVPRSAVLERDNRRTLVFVHEDGVAKWRYVTTGLGNTTHVEIVEDPETQGVKPGEMVLTAGHFSLTDGARVKLVESAAQADGRRP